MPTQNKPDWLANIKYIIWDLDGTLYPNQPELSQAINHKIIELIAEARQVSTEEAQDYYQRVYQQLHSSTLTLLEAGVDSDLVKSGDWFSQIQLKNIKSDPEFVQQLRQLDGYQHLVNTNSTQASAEEKLEKIGFNPDDFLAVVGNLDTVGVQKPKLKPFEYMLDLTSGQPSQHLFVGDRYETDLAPAKKVGMKTALVYGREEKSDLSFGDIRSLLDLLE